MIYRGLTWDHPRGYNALAAAAAKLDEAQDGLSIQWDKQPLEGFESHPIADLCARYDLVVLDHPHIGEAVASGSLRPLDAIFSAGEIEAFEAETIGPCLASYAYAGRHWALPLDAATQVLAYRADLLDGPPPRTWDEVTALDGPVALSLAGPHAALSFQSIAAALDESPAEADPETFIGRDTGRQVLDIMARLAARTPAAVRELNPIGLLGQMAASDAVALCPLVYGYVNYAAPASGKTVAFADAPRGAEGGRPGSTLGGTGIGISARTEITPALVDHLRWLMGAEAQERFIPAHDGQPSRRSAWLDEAVNARWNDFYRATAETLERAYVRPRHDGAIAFQTAASAALRAALIERTPHDEVLETLQRLYWESRAPGAER
jgi:multiple sugar transport system substrate-binding protein